MMLTRARATVLLTLLTGATASAQPSGDLADAWAFDEARQFDFWVGDWDVNLRVRQPDFTWKDDVRARAKIYRVLGGKAILELWDSPNIKGYSLRYFHEPTDQWILHLNWPSRNRSGTGSLRGGFRHGRGEFFSRSTGADGRRSISRYTFCDITPTSLRWDDAFSKDGGNTWTNNWIMEWTRREDVAEWPRPGAPAHTFVDGARCDLAEFRTFEPLAGARRGTVTVPGAGEVPATLIGYRALDGCAVLTFLRYEVGGGAVEELGVATFNTHAGRLEECRLDDARGTAQRTYFGTAADDGATLETVTPSSDADDRDRVRWTFDGASGPVTFARQRWSDAAGGWTTVLDARFGAADE